MFYSSVPRRAITVSRADFYPPEGTEGAEIIHLPLTALTVSTGVVNGDVTVSLSRTPDDGYGFELDLSPADAQTMADSLVEAAEFLGG